MAVNEREECDSGLEARKAAEGERRKNKKQKKKQKKNKKGGEMEGGDLKSIGR